MDMSNILDPATKTAVTEITKYLVNKVGGKIKNVYETRQLTDFSYEDLAERFSDYIQTSINEYSTIPTIALRDKEVLLNKLYQPLTLLDTDTYDEKELIEYDEEFFSKHPKMLIIDRAGMGKSTLSKFLFLSALTKKIEIPVFIELRRLKDGKTILDEIHKKFNYLTENFKKDYLIDLVKQGDFLFFFDGYDEIPNSDRERVALELKEFITNAGNNKFIITSRPNRHVNFPNFHKFIIRGLEQNEAFELIKKYDGITKSEIHDPLKACIKETARKYTEFLENPLYVSLLYVTFRRKRELPLSQAYFYRQVYEALYMDHDLTKDDGFHRDKESGLSLDELDKFLRRFAYNCLMKNLNDFNKDQFLNLIDEVADLLYFNKTIDESKLLKDLTENIPLFLEEGVSFKWIHKSFMEYFASNYISIQTQKEDILNFIKNHNNFDNYVNMLNIYADIDKESFDKVFVKPLLEHFVEYMEQGDVGNEIQRIKQYIYGTDIVFARISKETVDKCKDEFYKTYSHLEGKNDQKHVKREEERFIAEFISEKIGEAVGQDTSSALISELSDFSYITIGNVSDNYYLSNLLRILHIKGYEFIIESDGNKKKFWEDVKKENFLYELDILDNKTLILNNESELKDIKIQKEFLENTLGVLSSHRILLDYNIAKQYLERLNKQEKHRLNILGLM